MDKFLSEGIKDSDMLPSIKEGWTKSSIFLSLPCQGVKHVSEAAAPKYELKGLYHCRLLDVIKVALMEPAAEKFHLFPYRSYWKPSPSEPEQHIYSEAYTADYFLELYEKVHTQPWDATKAQLTPVVIGLMFWSDSTHLTSFGTASLWPIYIYFGNLSKYSRAKPSSFAAHHLAYIPKVSFSSMLKFGTDVSCRLAMIFKKYTGTIMRKVPCLLFLCIFDASSCRRSG
jgi:hypothetical protein